MRGLLTVDTVVKAVLPCTLLLPQLAAPLTPLGRRRKLQNRERCGFWRQERVLHCEYGLLWAGRAPRRLHLPACTAPRPNRPLRFAAAVHAGSCSPRRSSSRPRRASRRPLPSAPPFLRRPRWRRRWTSGTASSSGSWRGSPGRPRRPPRTSRTRCCSSTSGCATATRRCSACGQRISWRHRQGPRRGGGRRAGSLPGQPGPALTGSSGCSRGAAGRSPRSPPGPGAGED